MKVGMKRTVANLILLCACFFGCLEVGFASALTDNLFLS